MPDAPRRADPDTDVNQLRDNYDKGAAGVFDGTVDVVTGISLEEQRPNMNLDFHFVRTTGLNGSLQQRRRGLRSARPVRSDLASSRRSAPRPCTYSDW